MAPWHQVVNVHTFSPKHLVIVARDQLQYALHRPYSKLLFSGRGLACEIAQGLIVQHTLIPRGHHTEARGLRGEVSTPRA